tara:strand:+ start:1651 stop:2202 length:552 start_codon:yes stop_codon:yes gene_type:complete
MKGYIYLLRDNTNSNIYYGSTTYNINIRLSSHKNSYKLYLEGKYFYMTSFSIIKNNNYNIELVEEVECETKYELHNRERYYIENFDCVNKHIPNRTKKEYMTGYYEDNKDKIKEKNKVYYEDNTDKIKEKSKAYNKEYRKNNLEKIKEYKKEKITCECGAIVSNNHLSTHKRSKKHITLIKLI